MADNEDWWSKVPPLQACPLNSSIAEAKVDSGARTLAVRGYAVGGPSGQVKSVEVSIDEGRSWVPTKITYQEGQWSWTLWEAIVKLPDGDAGLHGKVYSRSVDAQGNQQKPDSDWNLRGVNYSGYGQTEY